MKERKKHRRRGSTHKREGRKGKSIKQNMDSDEIGLNWGKSDEQRGGKIRRPSLLSQRIETLHIAVTEREV